MENKKTLCGITLLGNLIYLLTHFLLSRQLILPIPAFIVTIILYHEYTKSYDGTLTSATLITIFRGYLAVLVLIPITLESYSISTLSIFSIIYGVAVALDNIDGRIARRNNTKTKFGENLDARFDGLGILSISLLLVLSSSVNPSYLIVGVATYIFNFYLYTRKTLGYQVYEYEEDELGRIIAGLQMFYATIALSPLLSGSLSEYTSIVATGITVLIFTRDTLESSGVELPDLVYLNREFKI